MLQNIRNNVQGLVAKIIIAIIIVPFAIFGVDTLIGSGGPAPAAKVNGAKISEDDLVQAIGMQKRQMLAMMGERVQPELLDDAKLRGPALESLITQQLLQQGADDLKLRVSAKVVDDTIRSVPQFQENGQFSPERYQQLLRDQNLMPAYYKQLLQRELVVDQLQSGIAESEFATPAEVEVVTGLLQQQRSYVYALLPTASLAGDIEISDADIGSYYQTHSEQYLRDERVKLEYIELRAADLIKPVDAAAVRAEYDKFAAAFKPLTERRAAHILVEVNDKRSDADALARAQDIAKKIAAGDKFESVAAVESDDTGSKGEGGDLGGSRGDSFPPAFEAALAALKVGEVSAPVKTDAGYHLIKLLDQHTETLPAFDAKKAEIEQQLARAEVQPQLLKTVEKLRDQVFNSEGLSGPAKDNQLTVKESDWIDRKTSDPLLGNAKVQAAAFSNEILKDGNNSDVIELTPEHFIVLRVKSHEAATPRPLEEVKPQIVATLKQERAVAAARQQAEQLKAQVQQGGDLQKLAQAAGYKAESVVDATRNQGSTNAEITRFAFNLGRPTDGKPMVDVAVIGTGDVAVLQVLAVKTGAKDSLDDTQRAGLVKQLEQMSGTADFVAYMDSLRKTAKIERQGE